MWYIKTKYSPMVPYTFFVMSPFPYLLKCMSKKLLTEDNTNNLPVSEELCEICILNNTTIINRCHATDVSKFVPGLKIQIDFDLFDVKSICGFNSNFV